MNLFDFNINVGLFLIASPSLGSRYADYVILIAKLFGQSQVNILRLVHKNTWLFHLNKEFRDIKERGRIKIYGRELIEHKPPKIGLSGCLGGFRRRIQVLFSLVIHIKLKI